MALKQTLTLKMGQQLRMTPQLQQAIRLLQLSTADLEMEIRQALDSNVMLEEIDPETADAEQADEPQPDKPEDKETPDISADEADAEALAQALEYSEGNPDIDGEATPDTSEQVAGETLGDELPLDSAWEDIFDDFTPGTHTADHRLSGNNLLETLNAEDVSIQSHLAEQIVLLNLTEQDLYIATIILEALNPDGVLEAEVGDILATTPPEWELEVEDVEAVLHLIQHLEPLGVASRSLQECLTIQLRHLPESTPLKNDALRLVADFLPQLANRDYTRLKRKLGLEEWQLKKVISLIRSLNPRPGADISVHHTDYIEPDIIVTRHKDRWLVELNARSTPRIRINREYASVIRRSDNRNHDVTRLRDHLQEAKWFLKSLHQRNDTLLRVASKIVEHQRDFFEHGEEAMKPLVLYDIAKAVNLHESTISRVTTQKYMLTPSGMYELKYFFSSHVSTHTGGAVSSTAIRALIKTLVAQENPGKPLSDSKIAGLLAERNIDVARRTIAKYREGLLIPPSNERKQLI